MGYEKQTWQDNVSVLSAERFNHMEEGIDAAARSPNILDIVTNAGVLPGDAISFNGTLFEKSGNADYLFDGQDAVKLGPMAYSSLSEDIGYTLYVQADGSLGLGATVTPCALILSENLIYVDFNPAFEHPKAYMENMVDLGAMPGHYGAEPYVRFKFQLPDSADGAELRGKSTPWADGDTKETGTSYGTFTDDTDCYGNFQWLTAEITGASKGAFIYFKFFPYKAGMFNEAIGENEVACTVGILKLEYLPQNLSGSAIADSSGNNGSPAATSGVTKGIGTGKVADSFDISSGYLNVPDCVWSASSPTLVLGVKIVAYAANTGLWGAQTRGTYGFVKAGGSGIRYARDYLYEDVAIAAGWRLVGINYLSAANTLRIDTSKTTGGYGFGSGNSLTHVGYSIDFISSTTHGYTHTGKMDFVRIFDGVLTDIDFANMYNGGDWI